MTTDTHNLHNAPGPADSPHDPNAPLTIVAGILGAILVVLIVVVLQAAFFRARDREDRVKFVAETPQELHDLRAAQIEKLQGYKWVDKKNGLVSIPIDRAMDLIVAGEQRKR